MNPQSNKMDIIYSTNPDEIPSQVYQVGSQRPQSIPNVSNYFIVKYYNIQNRQDSTVAHEYNVYPKH